jgi:hypothetical protein
MFDARRMVRETVAVYERVLAEREPALALTDAIRQPALAEPAGGVEAPAIASFR